MADMQSDIFPGEYAQLRIKPDYTRMRIPLGKTNAGIER